jgi:gluconate 2-dehydrogenase gamma chain
MSRRSWLAEQSRPCLALLVSLVAMPGSDHDTRPTGEAASPSRRRLFRQIALVPIAVAGGAALQSGVAQTPPTTAPNSQGRQAATGAAYRPVFFTADEWSFLEAACERLIPHDEHGPGALESGVPEFLDRHMQTPYAAGDIWYMQGPYLEAPSTFGYQGRLPLRDILRVGMANTDRHCRDTFGGKPFARLEPADQIATLTNLESGKIKLADISATLFFGYLLSETRNGYFADPSHGGNRDMGAWKMIGYPGVRADYLDWVTVRDRPYPIPPVDMSGRRG